MRPKEPAAGPVADDSYRAELHDQFIRFQELMGRHQPTWTPTTTCTDPWLLPHFLDLAQQYGLRCGNTPGPLLLEVLRAVGGRHNLEQISVGSLVRMLETEVHDASRTELPSRLRRSGFSIRLLPRARNRIAHLVRSHHSPALDSGRSNSSVLADLGNLLRLEA